MKKKIKKMKIIKNMTINNLKQESNIIVTIISFILFLSTISLTINETDIAFIICFICGISAIVVFIRFFILSYSINKGFTKKCGYLGFKMLNSHYERYCYLKENFIYKCNCRS